MKIAAQGGGVLDAGVPGGGVRPTQPVSGVSFASVMKAARGVFDGGLAREVADLTAKIGTKHTWQPQELLATQVRLSGLGLQVELVSKVADAAMGTVRKLQSGQ